MDSEDEVIVVVVNEAEVVVAVAVALKEGEVIITNNTQPMVTSLNQDTPLTATDSRCSNTTSKVMGPRAATPRIIVGATARARIRDGNALLRMSATYLMPPSKIAVGDAATSANDN